MNQDTFNGKNNFYYLDRVTADYIFDEIYNEKVYLQQGITLKAGDTIVDAGANIGMFSRYAAETAPGSTIYAIEPIPKIFEVMEANLAAELGNFITIHKGLGAETDTEVDFFYYPNCSADSTSTPFQWEEKIEGYLNNWKETVCSTNPLARIVPPFLRRFIIEKGLRSYYKPEKITCTMTTLSAVIRDRGITTIDLLKLDAENAEWDVLRGIEKEDFQKIRQIAMEVHEHIPGGRNLGERIKKLLEDRGFTVTIDKSDVRASMGVFMLYAKH